MIPPEENQKKAIYIPLGVRCMAYEPKKKRRKCDVCEGRGEWRWNAEIVCSRCLINVKLADQKEKVDHFIKTTAMVGRGDPDAEKELAECLDMSTDPVTLTDRGYWRMAHVVVIMHRTLRRGRA
jgi:hypothetical protein